MTRVPCSRLVAYLTVLAVGAMLGGPALAAGADKQGADDKKRAALWEALQKALPKEHEKIDVYAENPSLTAVLFRSNGVTLQFTLKSGKVEKVDHMKVLPAINRISFEEVRGSGAWVLWMDGRRELTIGGVEK